VVFELNGRKVFKSQVQKKTLTPVWNERFETMVESRAGSRFELEVFDWNQIETAKSLGTGIIDLTGLEPFEASEIDVPIQTIKHGSRGYVRVRLVFSPEMIMRSRKNTSTFSAAGRTLTSVGTAPIAVGKGVGKGVFAGGKGVAHGVGALGGFAGRKVGLVRKKDRSGHDVFVEEPFEEVDNIATEETGERDVYSTSGASFEAPDHTREPTDSPRTISKKQSYASFGEGKRNVSVTCLKGKEIDGTSTGEIKPYVHVQIGKKHHSTSHAKKSSEPEWQVYHTEYPYG
jgi:Ca2+-dependent lipid-binding protein